MTLHQVDSRDASVQVLIVDPEVSLPELEAARPDGGRWSGAWLFVRSGGVVAAVVEVAYQGRTSIPSSEVRELVDAALETADVRPLDTVPDEQLPKASVVVCTDLKRPDQLRACLDALVQHDYPDAEIIVVDNHRGTEADGILDDMVRDLPGVRVVREARPGLSIARNTGVSAARGAFVAFTDDDVIVDRRWLRAIGTRFVLRPDEEIVTGLILPTDLETIPQLWFERHYGGFGGPRAFAPLTYRGAGRRAPWSERARVQVLDWDGSEVRKFAVYGAGVCGAGANMSYRIETLRRLGGFDEALGAGTIAGSGEDLALFIEHLWSGGSIGFEPSALVSHSHRREYADLRKQLYNYGLGFTALMTAVTAADPRHLAGVASQVPAFVRSKLTAPADAPPPPVEDDAPRLPLGPPVPRELRWLEPRGGLAGPLAYVRSRLARRRAAR